MTDRGGQDANLSVTAMATIAFQREPVALRIDLGAWDPKTDEELYELCARNPELRIERTAEGEIVIMTPTGGASSHRSLEVAIALGAWAKRDGTGVAFDSSGGFVLPNGAMRAPDASWVARSRLEEVPPEARERFLPLCPDFVVEIRSPSDGLADLKAKMEEYRGNGARLGWLIDPEGRRVHVYRPEREVETLEDPPRLAADPELPGFLLGLAPIWAPL
jgi:Uma2 family endonuclease